MIDRRNRDLRATARAIHASWPVPMNLMELAHRAASAAAPCYYVNYDQALRVLSAMRRGRQKVGRTSRRRMYAELERKVEQMQLRHPRLGMARALQRVLTHEKASSFFILPKTAANVLSALRNR